MHFWYVLNDRMIKYELYIIDQISVVSPYTRPQSQKAYYLVVKVPISTIKEVDAIASLAFDPAANRNVYMFTCKFGLSSL